MKQTTKRSVVRFFIMISIAAAVGGVIGFFSSMLAAPFSEVMAMAGVALGYAAPGLSAVVMVVCFVWAYRAYGRAMGLAQSGKDEDVIAALDTLDGTMIALEIQSMTTVCMMAFSVAIMPMAPFVVLASVLMMLISMLAGIFAQRRVIEEVKHLCPEKRGDVLDRHFTRQWYESCDEAERARIGFAAYKSFTATQYGLVAAIAALVILSVVTPVSWVSFVALGAVWFVQKIVYYRHACRYKEG